MLDKEQTFIFSKINSTLLISDYLFQINNAFMGQLPKDLDFSDSCNRKSIFFFV